MGGDAACHSGASCSAFESFVLQVPASSSVTSSQPRGTVTGFVPPEPA
jgi:hypothetical protein